MVRLMDNDYSVNNKPCTICGGPVSGLMVSMGEDGVAHPYCFERRLDPTPAESVWAAVSAGRIPGTAQVLTEMLSPAQQQEFIDRMNALKLEQHRRYLINHVDDPGVNLNALT